jgi:hypothetical protein
VPTDPKGGFMVGCGERLVGLTTTGGMYDVVKDKQLIISD